MSDLAGTVLPVRIEDEDPSVDLPLPSAVEGNVIVLLAEEGPRRAGWAARVAVALARRWAKEGVRVFLADGDLGDPNLHELVGRDNGEGLADAVIYGASPSRIGHPVSGSAFLFASAGTVVADPDGAYAHPRWEPLLAAFRESGSVLLLYLPAEGGDGLGALVARGDGVIRLAAYPPAEDPGTGHVVIHPADEHAAPDELPAASFEAADPDGGSEEMTLDDDFSFEGLDGEIETDEAVTGDFSLGDESEKEDVWTGEAELTITDEWAGEDGPSSVPEHLHHESPSQAEAPAPEEAERPEAEVEEVEAGDREVPEERPGSAAEAPLELERSGPPAPARADMERPATEAPRAPARPPSPGGQPARASREPAPPRTREREPRGRGRSADRSISPLVLTILILVVVGVLVAAWLGYITIPGFAFGPGAAGPAGPSSASPSVTPLG